MPVSRPDEPEVVDLGLLDPVDPGDAPAAESAEARPPARGLPERLRRAGSATAAAWRSPTRASLAVAAAAGLLVGAVAYGTVDRQQELAAARADPLLVAQVVPNTVGGFSGAFNIAISVANASDGPVTIRAIALASDPDRFRRDGLTRVVDGQSQATLLLGAELGCDEPAPTLDRLQLEVTTADAVRRTLEMPLLVDASAERMLADQLTWYCGADNLGPALYSPVMVTEALDDPTEVRIRIDLQYQGGRDATLTDLVPVSDAFSVVADGMPRELERGIDDLDVVTVWRVSNCDRAALTGAFDATLAPVVDGARQQELVPVVGEPFADLVRLGTRICGGS